MPSAAINGRHTVANAKTFIAELPAGYDSRTVLALDDHNRVIATHPEHPPLVLDASGDWLDLLNGSVHPALTSSIG